MTGQAGVVGQIVGGSVDPLAAGFHLESEVFGVVVAIAAHDVEDHAPEQFGLLGVGPRQPVAELEEFEVIEIRHPEVGMHQSGDAVDVPAAVAGTAVEAAGDEVGVAFVARDQPGFGHVDSGGAGHPRVQVLDRAGGPVGGRDPRRELGQPVAVAVRQVIGAGDGGAVGFVDSDQDFRARAAGGGSVPDKRIQQFRSVAQVLPGGCKSDGREIQGRYMGVPDAVVGLV